MDESPVCKSDEHLFLPLLEVQVPLLRCVRCDVLAYQETVKQLAKKRAYLPDVAHHPPAPPSLWQRIRAALRGTSL